MTLWDRDDQLKYKKIIRLTTWDLVEFFKNLKNFLPLQKLIRSQLKVFSNPLGHSWSIIIKDMFSTFFSKASRWFYVCHGCHRGIIPWISGWSGYCSCFGCKKVFCIWTVNVWILENMYISKQSIGTNPRGI